MAFLHAHYAEPISRQDLARHVGMSEDYLTYCFRQELGMTPIAYLNRYRINQAKQLLRKRTKASPTSRWTWASPTAAISAGSSGARLACRPMRFDGCKGRPKYPRNFP